MSEDDLEEQLLLQQEDTALAEEESAILAAMVELTGAEIAGIDAQGRRKMFDAASEKPFRISRTTDDTGVRTTNMSDGSKVVSSSDGIFTYNENGEVIKEQTMRFAGLQITKNINPKTGAASFETNYRGSLNGVRINITVPGDARSPGFDMDAMMKNATSTKASFAGFSLGVNKNKAGKSVTSASFTGPSGNTVDLAKQFKTMDKKD